MTPRKSAAFKAVTQVTQYLSVPHLVSIRSRILALAVLGTVIPAGVSLGVAYSQNRRAREEKITQDLLSKSSQAAGTMAVWLKERIYDLRVFATSDEVSNNLNRFASSSIVGGRLGEYLRSLHERFPDFDQLMVLDPTGRMLATSALQIRPVQLPADWQKMLRQQNQLLGEPYWDDKAGKGKLIVAVPVQRADGRLLGAFAAELTLTPIQAQLKLFAPDTTGIIYLIHGDGAFIASSGDISAELLKTKLRRGVFDRLSTHEDAAVSYASYGREVVGTLKRVPQAPWAVVAEVSSDSAFAQVRHFRNVALLVILVLLLVVAATAYWLGHIIVRPLERLAEGAAEVSTGDLDVDLPDTGGGEVGALTIVFNHMVRRLREGREELERLSVTDGLTGLTNHRSMMQRLKEETLRAARNKHSFTVIMADVDHFKSYNDTFGHPAGDEVLKRVATLLRECTRAVDCAARYGGEEFAVLLPETDMAGASEVAERIRRLVESEPFAERAITLSIGIAEFPKDGDRPETVITVADAALYEAKRRGRNQVVQASKSVTRKAAEKAVLPTAKRQSRATKKKS
ncbi:MAG TPA: diguanylate cyclase [Gemmatimonadaceae bacterium]